MLSKNPIRFFLFFIRKQSLSFFSIWICGLTFSVSQAFFPYFIKKIINKIYSIKPASIDIFIVLKWPLLSLILSWFIIEVSLRIQGYIILFTIPRFKATIREKVYDYVIKHSCTYFIDNFSGKISQKIFDLPKSCEILFQIINFKLFQITVTLFVSIFLMWSVNIIFCAIILGWCFVQISVSVMFYKKSVQSSKYHAEILSNLNGYLVDSLNNIRTMHLFFRNEYENAYMKKIQGEEIEKNISVLLIIEKIKLIQGILSSILIITMICLLIYGWSKEFVTIGDFSLIIMLSINMIELLWNISFQMATMFQEIGSIKSALELIFVEHKIKDIDKACVLKVDRGEIYFKNVSFKYTKHTSIFKNLTMVIKGGEKVGLVGFTGSGKTTFINLLLRFYDTYEGKILIDGKDITNVTQKSLREQISVIPQELCLFHRTIMENIRYGKIEATDKEVIEASKIAHCHEFIEKLKDGYDSIVGERGIKLSFGQRQRISIARAVLKNSPIIILDEATSSLDYITEKIIQKNLDTLMKNRTSIIIAHRLSTLSNVDRIIVLKEGKIVEDGRKEELLQLNGFFSKLYNAQIDEFFPKSIP